MRKTRIYLNINNRNTIHHNLKIAITPPKGLELGGYVDITSKPLLGPIRIFRHYIGFSY